MPLPAAPIIQHRLSVLGLVNLARPSTAPPLSSITAAAGARQRVPAARPLPTGTRATKRRRPGQIPRDRRPFLHDLDLTRGRIEISGQKPVAGRPLCARDVAGFSQRERTHLFDRSGLSVEGRFGVVGFRIGDGIVGIHGPGRKGANRRRDLRRFLVRN
ncbi:hypothetical protein BHE74_00002123 [Ensete ventricosum]|nr:hypothetical protein BHE74_00002123 [Ensete ventricosum]